MATVDLTNAFAIQNGLIFDETGIAVASALSSPASGPGTYAPIGSLWLSPNDGVFLKNGATDLSWINVIAPYISAGQITISGSDSTGDYLFDKLAVSSNLSKTITSPNANESLLLDLSDVGSSGTYVSVTTDAKGRVVSGSATQNWSTLINTPTTISGYGINVTYTDLPIKLYKENPIGFTPGSATGDNSIALGQAANATAIDSLAIGKQSLSRIQGGIVQASGRFASSGDAQAGKYLLRTHTVNQSTTELFVDGTGGSVRLELQDNSTWTFRAMITGHRTDSDDGHAGFEVSGVIYRGSGANTTSILGQISKTVIARSDSAWDINIVSDTSNGSLKVTAKGEVGKVIRWVALIETLEITN